LFKFLAFSPFLGQTQNRESRDIQKTFGTHFALNSFFYRFRGEKTSTQKIRKQTKRGQLNRHHTVDQTPTTQHGANQPFRCRLRLCRCRSHGLLSSRGRIFSGRVQQLQMHDD